MADGKELSNTVVAFGSPVTTAGAAFVGNITRATFGGYYHANDAANTAPRIYTLVDGSPAPTSPPNGSLAFYYAP